MVHPDDDADEAQGPDEFRRPDDLARRDERGLSRSERRREALDVLAVAHRLLDVPAADLDRVPMEDDLRELVMASRRITQQIARKRQTQFLAKHLRRDEEATAAIRDALDHERDVERRETARLHRVERWRAKLVDGDDDTLGELVAAAPSADRQQLRTLMRRAREERDQGKPPAASRALFRVLRDLLDSE